MSTLVETAEVDQALDASGKTKLIVCCENKDVTGARRLLDSNASPDIANRDGQTPLYVSCKAGARAHGLPPLGRSLLC
jgi:ankyrin repeat protein